MGQRQTVHTRSDATERNVWLGSALFGYRIYFLKLNEIETYNAKFLIFEMDSSNW